MAVEIRRITFVYWYNWRFLMEEPSPLRRMTLCFCSFVPAGHSYILFYSWIMQPAKRRMLHWLHPVRKGTAAITGSLPALPVDGWCHASPLEPYSKGEACVCRAILREDGSDGLPQGYNWSLYPTLYPHSWSNFMVPVSFSFSLSVWPFQVGFASRTCHHQWVVMWRLHNRWK